MASIARLPSLSSLGGDVTQQLLQQIPSPPKLEVILSNTKSFPNRKWQSPDDENLKPTKIETERHRNTYSHNLCVDMLKDGFHQSFCQLFNLMKSNKDALLKMAFESGSQDEPLLQDQPQKLAKIKMHLMDAETAARRGKMDVVYNSYLTLATYFEQSGDISISNHFYKLCLDTSVKIRGDGRRRESEANFNMGIAHEKQGDFRNAMQCFEQFYLLTSGQLWKMEETGRLLFAMGCESLQNVYTTLANQIKASSMLESISYLLKAYKVAKEGDDKKNEGDASYLLGLTYMENNDIETALLYHNEYLKICEDTKDYVGMGRAHRALAKCYEKQTNIDLAVEHLQEFVHLSERSNEIKECQKAYSSIAEILNFLGKFEESAKFVERSYELTKKMEKNDEKKDLVRTEYGIVSANLILFGVSQSMENTASENIKKLLDWKQSRENTFVASMSKYLPVEKLEYER